MDQVTIQQLIFQKQTELERWHRDNREEELDSARDKINATVPEFNEAKRQFGIALDKFNDARSQFKEYSREWLDFQYQGEGKVLHETHTYYMNEMVRWEKERNRIAENEFNPIAKEVRKSRANIERLQNEIAALQGQLHAAEVARSVHDQEEAQLRDYRNAAEAEAQRAHELEMARLQHETTMAQLEMTRLTAEANAKAQEQASQTLDDMIRATSNGETED